MKKHLYLLFIALFAAQIASAKIWRVNNNVGINADFTTLQAAHDAAGVVNGDIIHVEASATSYGSLNCTKQLTIIGPGYFLGENPNTQATDVSARASGISFNNGSSGSQLMGMTVGDTYVYTSNISIRRNHLGFNGSYGVYIAASNISNIVISQNYITGSLGVYSPSTASNILITNNFISSGSYSIILSKTTTSSVIQNNVLSGNLGLHNSAVFNNILRSGTFTDANNTNNNTSNNLANGTQFGSANGNKQNVDMTNVFVGAGTGVSTDGQWKLKTGSPAIGAGFGSTAQNPVDAGIFSGSTPYVLSGMPPIPSIYSFDIQPIGSNSDPIDVTIKVKSNN